MAEQLSWIGLDLPEDWENIHYGLLTGRKPFDLRYKKWIKTIIKHNKKYKVFNHHILKKTLWDKWTETVYFEFAKSKKIKILLTLPISCYFDMIKIKNSRLTKEEN